MDRESERERALPFTALFSNGCNEQGWTRTKPRYRCFFHVSYVGKESVVLGHLLLISQVCQQEDKINSILEILKPQSKFHIRCPEMTSGGYCSSQGTNAVRMLLLLFSPIANNGLMHFPLLLDLSHPNQWSTWVCIILSSVKIIKNNLKKKRQSSRDSSRHTLVLQRKSLN